MPVWLDFWFIFPSNLPSKIYQNRWKIDAKMHFILDSIFGLIFDRFWLPTWISWTQFGTSGLASNSFFRVFWKIVFWSNFGTKLAPFWLPKSNKIHPKMNSKKHPKNDRFLDRFFAEVGSVLETKLGPKSRSRRSQNAPKTLPRRPPRRHQDRPRATRASKIEI